MLKPRVECEPLTLQPRKLTALGYRTESTREKTSTSDDVDVLLKSSSKEYEASRLKIRTTQDEIEEEEEKIQREAAKKILDVATDMAVEKKSNGQSRPSAVPLANKSTMKKPPTKKIM